MVRFEQRGEPPQLVVEMAGTITFADLEETAVDFEEALQRMPPGFVLLNDITRATEMEPGAVGTMAYLTRKTFEAQPRLVLFVESAVISPPLRQQMERLDEAGVLRFFSSRAGADAFLAGEAA